LFSDSILPLRPSTASGSEVNKWLGWAEFKRGFPS
jgi:hypothetical protein